MKLFKLQKKLFTYKINFSSVSFGELNSQINIKDISDKMEKIINNFKENKKITRNKKFFVQYCIFYDKIDDLHLILNALVLEYKKYQNTIKGNEHLCQTIIKNYKDLLLNYYKNLNISDFNQIYSDLLSVINHDKVFKFILSEVLKLYLTETQDDKIVEKWGKELSKLSNLPYGKRMIADYINKYFKNSSQFNIDIVESFLPYEIYLSYEVRKNMEISLSDIKVKNVEYPNIILNKIEHTLKNNKIDDFSEEFYDKVSSIIEKINDTDNELSIKFIEKIISHYIYTPKLDIKHVKYFNEILSITNPIIFNYMDKFDKRNFDYNSFISIKNYITYISKNYSNYKTFYYTDDKFLIDTFLETHNNLYKFYKLLNGIKISNVNESYIITEILKNNYINNIDSSYCNEFNNNINNYILNFDDELYDFKLLYNFIFVQLSKKSLDHKSIIILLNKYIDCNEKIDKFQRGPFFSNLTSIIYNLILSKFEDEEYFERLLKTAFIQIKLQGNKINSNILRLMLIQENIKLIYPGLYTKYEKEFVTLKKLFDILDIPIYNNYNNIWWDKSNFNRNKYTSQQIQDYLSKIYNKVERFPNLNKLYHSDFLINDDYLELIGPYHIINKENPNQNKNFNDKFIRKINIFRSYSREIKTINYLKVIENIDTLNKLN